MTSKREEACERRGQGDKGGRSLHWWGTQHRRQGRREESERVHVCRDECARDKEGKLVWYCLYRSYIKDLALNKREHEREREMKEKGIERAKCELQRVRQTVRGNWDKKVLGLRSVLACLDTHTEREGREETETDRGRQKSEMMSRRKILFLLLSAKIQRKEAVHQIVSRKDNKVSYSCLLLKAPDAQIRY